MTVDVLPLREPLLEGEGLTSFVRRHASAMSYESLQRILILAEGITFPKQLEFLGRGPPLGWLARFLRRTSNELLAMTVHRWGNRLEPPGLSTQWVRKSTASTCDRFFDFAHRRVCPACLADPVPYERLLWSFKPLVHCPQHRLLLIDRCPRCRRGLSPRRLDARRCSCGTALAEVIGETAGNGAPCVTAAMLEWLQGTRQPSIDLSGWPLFYWLDRLRSAILKTPAYQMRIRAELELPPAMDDESAAWLAAARLLQQGSLGLNDLLDELQRIGRRQEPSTRAGRAFRELQRDAERLESVGYAAPADELRRYLLERYTQGHVTVKGILFRAMRHRPALANRPWITQTEASRRLGLRPPSVATLVRRGVLAGRIDPSGPRGRTNGVVLRESVNRYARRLSEAWTVKRTAKRLGIDQPRVLELIKADLLKDAVRGPQGWLIPDDVVGELLERMRQLPVIPVEQNDCLSLREALRRLGVHGLNLVRLLQLVLVGQLTALRDPASDAVSGLFFMRADVGRLAEKAQVTQPLTQGYSLSSVGSHLVPRHRVGSRCLRKWIAVGLLVARRGRKSWWIEPTEVKRFRATYCVAREACSRLGIARSTLDRWEVEGRLVPVYGRRTHSGAGTSLFLTADVERLVASRAA